jgi:hypothetical protein
MAEALSDLGRFQTAFAAALDGDAAALSQFGLSGPTLAAGLAVYRNTIARGTIDALAMSYPTVRRLVGEDWFEAAARAFIALRPPRERALIDYGGDFPDFLEGFAPAADLPYLAGVARIDRLWLEAHAAADAPAWTPAQAAALAPADLFALRLRLHPSARIAWFEALAIPSLWRLSRPPAPEAEAAALRAEPEGLLLVRPAGAVEALILDRAAFTLLEACRAGASLGEAAEAALDADPAIALPAVLLRLTKAGAFAAPLELEDSR